MKTRIALQMYTLRDFAARDYLGALDRVAAMGYEGVELSGVDALPAPAMARALADRGLAAAGCHVPLEALERELGRALDYCEEIGCSDIVCPWADYASAEDYGRAAGLYERIGRECARRGIALSYHNHAHELAAEVGGVRGLDAIYRAVDARYLKAEIDVYWVRAAGLDPREYVERYRGRMRLLHLKDMSPGPEPTFAAIGEGIIDFGPIVASALGAGVPWLVVEQDLCPRDPFDCVAASLAALRAIAAAG